METPWKPLSVLESEEIIIKYLKEESVSTIGICEFSGKDGTKLGTQIGEKVKREKLFNVVLMVRVGMNFDSKRAVREISDYFGLSCLVGKSFVVIANELLSKLMSEQRILVVLDDVIDSLDIEKIQSSMVEHPGSCKFMITSRFARVFSAMGAQKIFRGQEIELWIQFKERVGLASLIAGDSSRLPPLENKIANRILTVATGSFRMNDKCICSTSRHNTNSQVDVADPPESSDSLDPSVDTYNVYEPDVYQPSLDFTLCRSPYVGRRIGELREMNEIRGSLTISGLEKVATKEEAAQACLYNKQHLKRLVLSWEYDRDGKNRDEKNPDHEDILESLRPPFGIYHLDMLRYRGGVAPSWMSNPLFTKLIRVTVHACMYFDCLPSLGKLAHLKNLSITKNNEVVEFNTFSCRNHDNHQVAFPKLKHLSFSGMMKLEKWTGLEKGDFPFLVYISISDCQKFVGLPSLSHLPSLSTLVILGCPELSYLPEDGLPHKLNSLMIEGSPKLQKRIDDKQSGEWMKIAHVPRLQIGHILR